MESIKVQMPEQKASQLRQVAMQIYGHKKGAISAAINSAIDQWFLSLKTKKKKNPVDWSNIKGALGKSVLDSVKLQHAITKELWPSSVD